MAGHFVFFAVLFARAHASVLRNVPTVLRHSRTVHHVAHGGLAFHVLYVVSRATEAHFDLTFFAEAGVLAALLASRFVGEAAD